MKRIATLVTAFLMIAGASYSFAQQDADHFYKSDQVKTEKVSFPNQYKMKIAGNFKEHLK